MGQSCNCGNNDCCDEGFDNPEVLFLQTYVNDGGLEEFVSVTEDDQEVVIVRDSIGGEVRIYFSDVPKLIQALKAAYLFENGEEI